MRVSEDYRNYDQTLKISGFKVRLCSWCTLGQSAFASLELQLHSLSSSQWQEQLGPLAAPPKRGGRIKARLGVTQQRRGNTSSQSLQISEHWGNLLEKAVRSLQVGLRDNNWNNKQKKWHRVCNRQLYLYEVVQVAQFSHVTDSVWFGHILKNFPEVFWRLCRRKKRKYNVTKTSIKPYCHNISQWPVESTDMLQEGSWFSRLN